MVGGPGPVVGELDGARWGDVVDIDGAGGIDAISAAVLSGARTLYTLSRSEATELLTVVACGRGPDIVPDLTDEEEALTLVPDTDDGAQGGPSAPEPAGQPAGPAPVLTIPPALELRPLDLRSYGRVRVLVDGREVLKAMPDAGRQVLALLALQGELTEPEAVHALGAGSADQVWRSRFVRGTRGTRPALREALGDSGVDPSCASVRSSALTPMSWGPTTGVSSPDGTPPAGPRIPTPGSACTRHPGRPRRALRRRRLQLAGGAPGSRPEPRHRHAQHGR
jgi:hypothetical protein